MTVDATLQAAFAPSGTLRVTINFGNPILANRRADGAPYGISVDLARQLANELALPLELVTVESAAKSVLSVATGNTDVGFFAVDPVRGAEIAFSQPYILIEGNYLVRQDAPYRSNQDVDQPGVRVAVAGGSAYDLFLTRELQHATIVRGATSPEVVNTFLRDGLDVAAGVRQQLEADAARLGGLRLIETNFMVIRQAMGVAKSRPPQAAAWLGDFVERMKANGFVGAAMQRHGIEGATVAP